VLNEHHLPWTPSKRNRVAPGLIFLAGTQACLDRSDYMLSRMAMALFTLATRDVIFLVACSFSLPLELGEIDVAEALLFWTRVGLESYTANKSVLVKLCVSWAEVLDFLWCPRLGSGTRSRCRFNVFGGNVGN
jgi:hypothetical protein